MHESIFVPLYLCSGCSISTECLSPQVPRKLQCTLSVTTSNGTPAESLLQLPQLEPVPLDGHSPGSWPYVTDTVPCAVIPAVDYIAGGDGDPLLEGRLALTPYFLPEARLPCCPGEWDETNPIEQETHEREFISPFLQLVVPDIPLQFFGTLLLWFLLPSPGLPILYSVSNPNLQTALHLSST